MRICVFSDIHGNGEAFRQALPAMKREAADIYLYLGDFCGYYFDQEEIFPDLMALPNLVAISGNHDQMLLEISSGNEALRRDYLEKYGPSMEVVLDQGSAWMVRWLASLPRQTIDLPAGLTGAHGSPWDPLEGYIYPDTLLDQFLEFPPNSFVLGHTHYPMKRQVGQKWVLNPGSLGQPRNGGWPTYAIIDGPPESFRLREVPYDRDAFAARVEKHDAGHHYLKRVLYR
jgi:predicted phosphodiesterase